MAFPNILSNVPGLKVVCLTVVGAADVDADGYTISAGGNDVSTVAKNGEGVIDITTKFAFNELAWAGLATSDVTTGHMEVTTVTSSSRLVKLTLKNFSDAAADPDGDTLRIMLVFNVSGVSVA